MNCKKKDLLILIIFLGLIICLIIILFLIQIGIHERDIYNYGGIDCYISYNKTQSLSNITQIMDEYDFSYTIWYQRSSPAGTGDIVDYIAFSFNNSSPKKISGQIFNFNSDNLTIKLHYYTDEHPDRLKYYRTYEEAENSSYSQYLYEKDIFEEEVEYIISIFNSEFDSIPQSISYVQFIQHGILG